MMDKFDLRKYTEVRDIPLHSTGMSDYERCPRYFLLRHRAGLVPRGSTSPALRRGQLLHSALASLLRGRSQSETEHDLLFAMAQSIADLMKQVSPAGYLPNGKTPEQAAKAIESDARTAIAMVRSYVKFFELSVGGLGGYPLLDGAIEVRMTSPDGQASTLDAVLVDTKRREAWVVDHKSHGWSPKVYARTLPLSAQTLIYPDLLREYLKSRGADLTVAGICYNIIRTPTIRCSREDDFDLTRYAGRVERWYQDYPDDSLLRTWIRPSPELGMLSHARLNQAKQACVAQPLLGDFPATGGSPCNAYNSPCPFLGLCTRDVVLWPDELTRYDKDWRDDEDD